MILSMLCFGNDFMPSLGMFSLREDGYERALEMYELARNPDLTTEDGRRQFLEYAASKEIETFRKRISLRKRPEERTIIGKKSSLISKKYGLHILDGVSNMKPVVEAYWKTFHWSYYYFKNSKPINWGWSYPYSDAPLISDIMKYSETDLAEESPLNFTLTNQLQFIMPQSSLRKCRRRVVFPDELHSETRNPWMKRHDWEMKPRISLPWNPIYDLTTVSLL
jgi:5'-3' exonuclease